MSQKGSSIVSNENPEVKYKKALMQIQKIHNANKVLKSQSEQMKAEYERQIHEMELSLQHFQKENEDIKNDKVELEKFLEQLQVSNTELRKEYNNLEREVTYLNDVLTEQNTELKKVNAFKDEKGLTTLITSYEDREINYRKDIARQQDLVKSLKNSCQTLESDLTEERRQRFKLEDLNNSLKMEISKYRELNNNLLNKNQSIVTGLLNRTSEGREKYREAESILSELGRQLDLVKSTRIEQNSLQRTTVSLDSYEGLLQQKNKIEGEIHRLRERLDDSEHKSKGIFEIEQKMKKATLRADQLHQECNMLKSKLVVVETKQLMEALSDVELKEYEERVIVNIGQNDPLPAIKNSSDSSHFQLMKAYVVELKDKLTKALLDKKEYEKKYRSLKEKIGEKAEKAMGLEDQNKLLRGKLQGFERLSERLQFELERNMQDHEEEINKMKQMTNNILNKKGEETKVANAFIRAQLDLQLDKFERAEKGLRQEIETLKLQLSTEKIKAGDLQDKLKQANQFLAIYKNKFEEVQVEYQEVQQANAALSDNSLKFEQLYREERAKNESFLSQKQALTTKISQAAQENEKRFLFENSFQEKEAKYEVEIRKLKVDLGQAKNQIVQLENNLKLSSKQVEEKIRLATSSAAKLDSGYYNSLEQNYQNEREKNRLLESELTTLKLRIERSNSQSQKVASLEDSLSKKADELNDLKRKSIGFEKQVGILEAQLTEMKNELANLKKENATLKAKLIENGQTIRKTYESKEVQSKRSIQKMNQELATTTSQLREEKRTAARLQGELQNIKNEFRRYEEIIEQAKRKQLSASEQLNQLRNDYESTGSENERLKSEVKYKNSMQEGMNSEISNVQDRIFKLNQENTQIRLKMQSTDNDYSELRRQLGGLKIYLNEIQDYSNSRNPNGGWQEQRDKENLASFVQRLKKILRTSEISQQNLTDYRSGNYNTNISEYRSINYQTTLSNQTPLPDFLKPYVEQSFNRDQKFEPNSSQSSPFVLNENNYLESYATEGAYKYNF